MRFFYASAAALAAVLFGVVPIFAQDVPATVDDPPAGIVATSTTLSSVLREHAAAMTVASNAPAATRERWTLDEAGRAGTETIVRRGDDYHSVFERDGSHEEFGKLGSATWHLDANGIVSPTEHPDEQTFSMQRVLEDANDPKNDVKLLGVTLNPAAYVVEVRRPFDNHPRWVFFDRSTGYVTCVERVSQGDRVVDTYEDYRSIGGTVRPWHVVDTFPASGITFAYTLASSTTADAPADAEFAAPAGTFRPSLVTAAEVVPSSVQLFSVIVRLNVAGRGLDFALSAGSKRSYIDRNVALEMGLPTFGQPLNTTNGAALAFDTMLADGTVGGIALHNFALRAVNISYRVSGDTKIVGVLGSDFLHSGIFTIDYVKNRVEAAPSSAAAAASDADALVLPVRFDDGEPFVSATIGGHAVTHAKIDNAFPITTIFGSFASKYPDAVPDDNGKAKRLGSLPFADNAQYGRSGTIWISKVSSLELASLDLQQYSVLATTIGKDSEIEAIFGMNYLTLFDVEFDLAHGRIVLRKNQHFRDSFESVKP